MAQHDLFLLSIALIVILGSRLPSRFRDLPQALEGEAVASMFAGFGGGHFGGSDLPYARTG